MSRHSRALEAYKAILMEPLKPGEAKFTPSPSEHLKDKKWSKELRLMWPDYRRVVITDTRFYSEKKKWCEDFANFYWVAGNQTHWHFSDHKSAVAFKLSFGGNIE